jgi:hypothetical protein
MCGMGRTKKVMADRERIRVWTEDTYQRERERQNEREREERERERERESSRS